MVGWRQSRYTNMKFSKEKPSRKCSRYLRCGSLFGLWLAPAAMLAADISFEPTPDHNAASPSYVARTPHGAVVFTPGGVALHTAGAPIELEFVGGDPRSQWQASEAT